MEFSPSYVQISGNADVQPDMTFDDYQLQQFTIFESEYKRVDTEIRKHPEWHGNFMSFFLHAEGKGEDLRPYYEVADWLSKNQMPSDANTGKIGASITILQHLLNIAKMGKPLPKELPLADDGTVDEFMLNWKLIEKSYEYKGHPKLISGRLCIYDVGLFDEDFFYSEGNRKVHDILNQLGDASSHKYNRQFSASEPEAAMAENWWAHNSIKHALDDMNIRGVQVLDALEYVGGSVQKLQEHLHQPLPMDTIDENIAKYCNMKAAQRIRDKVTKSEFIAVHGGASFDKEDMSTSCMTGYRNPDLIPYRYKMSVLNYKEYLIDMEPLTEDWSKVDIIQGTDFDTAMKAAESRGFKMIRRTNERARFGDKSFSVLMYNPQTGAFLSAPSARLNDINYGGCNIDLWESTKSIPFEMLMHGSSGCVFHYQDVCWHNITASDGLFSQYDNVVEYLDASSIDWNKLGFAGSDTIPVPTYFDRYYGREDELAQFIGYEDAHMICDMGGYRMGLVLNALIAHYDMEIDATICPQYALIREDRIFRDCLDGLCLWDNQNIYEGLKILRLIQIYLNLPDEDYNKLIASMRQILHERDELELSRINEQSGFGHVRDEMMARFNSLEKYFDKNIKISRGFKNDKLIVEKVLAKDGNTADTLGVKFPWSA